MRICFFSDIHGVASSLEDFFAAADKFSPDLFVLLGDALSHGPRNGLPDSYDPGKTAHLLNLRKNKIIAVRGNCDSEVDQTLLEFPMLADCTEIFADGRRFFATHGHLWNACKVPPIPAGASLVSGHTHVPEKRVLSNGVVLFNPGSISLPKGGTSRSFGYFDGLVLGLYDF